MAGNLHLGVGRPVAQTPGSAAPLPCPTPAARGQCSSTRALPEPSRRISGAAATGLCLLGGQAEDPAAKGFDSPVSTLSFPWGSLSLTELFHGMLLLSFTVG